MRAGGQFDKTIIKILPLRPPARVMMQLALVKY
jgi:hypothetical protein